MTSAESLEEETLAEGVARRVRGVMGEQRVSGSELARRLGMTQAAFSRRTTGATAFRLDEISAVAGALGVAEGYLLGYTPRTGLPRLDSNQQPFD